MQDLVVRDSTALPSMYVYVVDIIWHSLVFVSCLKHC